MKAPRVLGCERAFVRCRRPRGRAARHGVPGRRRGVVGEGSPGRRPGPVGPAASRATRRGLRRSPTAPRSAGPTPGHSRAGSRPRPGGGDAHPHLGRRGAQGPVHGLHLSHPDRDARLRGHVLPGVPEGFEVFFAKEPDYPDPSDIKDCSYATSSVGLPCEGLTADREHGSGQVTVGAAPLPAPPLLGAGGRCHQRLHAPRPSPAIHRLLRRVGAARRPPARLPAALRPAGPLELAELLQQRLDPVATSTSRARGDPASS